MFIFSLSKPKLTAAQLVKKMENEKGIKFQLITRTAAAKFLSERNNYLRIASYRKNYDKYKGKYCNLDFKYLIELSTLDMYFRNIIMKMTISIEHSLKVKLIRDIELDATEDGYSVVSSFLNLKNNRYVLNDIIRKSSSQYSGELIQHYLKYDFTFDSSGNEKYEFDCPAWVFVEIISFGTFIKFYDHYYQHKHNKPIKGSLLNSVRSLRNACAHNNCILHNLRPSSKTAPPSAIVSTITNISSIGKGQKMKKLSNQFILEFVTLLYVFDTVVSEDIKKYTFKELKQFSDNRLIRHIDYFKKQSLVETSISFLRKVIDFFAK